MTTPIIASADLAVPVTIFLIAFAFAAIGLALACWAGRGDYHAASHKPPPKDVH